MKRFAARLISLASALTALLGAAADPTHAQGGAATKPLRMIVPFPPGGAADLVARHLQQPLSEALGQPVVVENKSGANGIIGTEAMVRSPADGSVVGFASSWLAAIPSIHNSLPFDVLKDIRPITIVTRAPNLFSVPATSKITSLTEIIEDAKRRPGKVIVVTSGNGTAQHFGLEQLKISTVTDIVHLPYKGAGPALNDLVAGQVEVGLLNIAGSLTHVRSGGLKPIAVTSAKRSAALPNVPAVAETLPGFDFSEWFAMIGPAGIPDEVVERLYTAVATAARTPAYVAKIREAGMELDLNTPAEFRALMAAEHQKLGAIARTAGIKLD